MAQTCQKNGAAAANNSIVDIATMVRSGPLLRIANTGCILKQSSEITLRNKMSWLDTSCRKRLSAISFSICYLYGRNPLHNLRKRDLKQTFQAENGLSGHY